jgi:alpha-L-fucosidase
MMKHTSINIVFGALAIAMLVSQASAQSPEVLALPKAETYLPKIKAELQRMDAAVEQGPYRPELASLKKHKSPEWIQDAKFGLWLGWSAQVVATERVPAKEIPHADWYYDRMYRPGNKLFEFHRQQFGDQAVFGLKDLFPRFKAEKFDPDAIAALYAESGARFGGLIAAFAENLMFWDSEVTRWNTKLIGPTRDLVGEFLAALRKKDLRTIVTSHHEMAWGYFGEAHQFDAADPQWSDLYGESPKLPSSQRYNDRYLATVNELVRKYSPDLLYFDLGMPAGSKIGRGNALRLVTAAYNQAEAQGREFDILHKHHDLAESFGILDNESHLMRRLQPNFWTVDIPMSSTWYLQKGVGYKSNEGLVQMLVDVVSKNGGLFLCVPLRADGSVPEEVTDRLHHMGAWLKVNGEAIYGTRPWRVAEEGAQARFGKELHFTRKGSTCYAVAGTWPKGRLKIQSMASGSALCPEEIVDVFLLGYGPVKWSRQADGLLVEMPAEPPCNSAYVVKILTRGRTCTEPQATLADDTGQFTASALVSNFTEQPWQAQVQFLVAGKPTAAQTVTLSPGQSRRVSFTGHLPGTGLHKVAIAADTFSSPTVGLLTPRLALAGPWRFHRDDDPAWSSPACDEKDWETVVLPGEWHRHSNLPHAAAGKPMYGWYRKTIRLPAEAQGCALKLTIGKVDDRGWAFFNGEPLGETEFGSAGFAQVFEVPAALVRPGADNVIAVRVSDTGGAAGITGEVGFVEFLPNQEVKP